MTNLTPSQQRLERITVLRAELARTLANARQESMQTFIRHAGRDLDEASLWLEHENIDRRPYILMIADAAIAFASARLNAAEEALSKFGPDAMLLG